MELVFVERPVQTFGEGGEAVVGYMHWCARVQLMAKVLQKGYSVESRAVKRVLVVNHWLLGVHFESRKRGVEGKASEGGGRGRGENEREKYES